MVEHTSRRQGIMQRMELIDERNEMRDMIKELGGEDPLNIIKSYLGQEDPRIIEGRYRSGKPRTQMVEGLTIKGLEPQTMEEKQIIADLLKQYGSMSEISRAIEAGELAIGAAAIPALIKAGVKGVRKLKDPAVRDMLTPNIFKSSKQGPLTAVGAAVSPPKVVKLNDGSILRNVEDIDFKKTQEDKFQLLDDVYKKEVKVGAKGGKQEIGNVYNVTPKETAQDVVTIRLLRPDFSNQDIAFNTGLDRTTVGNILKKVNLIPGKKGKK